VLGRRTRNHERKVVNRGSGNFDEGKAFERTAQKGSRDARKTAKNVFHKRCEGKEEGVHSYLSQRRSSLSGSVLGGKKQEGGIRKWGIQYIPL